MTTDHSQEDKRSGLRERQRVSNQSAIVNAGRPLLVESDRLLRVLEADCSRERARPWFNQLRK